MSVKIRLSQTGKANARSFRIVVMDESQKRDGSYIELLGSIDKSSKKQNFKAERYAYWISKGARATTTVKKIVDSK